MASRRARSSMAHALRAALAAVVLALGSATLNVRAARPARPAAQSAPPLRPQTATPPASEMPDTDLGPPKAPSKQQRALLKARYAKMKDQADQLARLAQALQADLEKANENVLSLDVVDKADKIEKLAKQIKSAAVE